MKKLFGKIKEKLTIEDPVVRVTAKHYLIYVLYGAALASLCTIGHEKYPESSLFTFGFPFFGGMIAAILIDYNRDKIKKLKEKPTVAIDGHVIFDRHGMKVMPLKLRKEDIVTIDEHIYMDPEGVRRVPVNKEDKNADH
jgi:hypothetical protein